MIWLRFILSLGLVATFIIHSDLAQAKISYSAKDVAQHSSAEDCWVIVDKNIYDLTSYLPDHEKHGAGLEEFCGQDATSAWNSKGSEGLPHSRKAQIFLRKYKKGKLSPAPEMD